MSHPVPFGNRNVCFPAFDLSQYIYDIMFCQYRVSIFISLLNCRKCPTTNRHVLHISRMISD